MKTQAEIPLFRSRGQAAVLRDVFLHGDGVSLSDLAASTGLSSSTVHHEVERLERAGLLRSVRHGRTRLVQPDERSPLAADLSALVIKALGPPAVITGELERVAGVRQAYIYGSWARRARGDQIPLARDIDLLVVGRVDHDDVYTACLRAEKILRLDVNPVVVSAQDWDDPATEFLKAVRAGALVSVTR